MTLYVRDFLLAGGTCADLLARHGVHARPYHGKVSFVYDQYTAKRDDALACQCRGLVLREGTWDVVAYPFDRFFNYGEAPFAAQVDWSTAAFEEKLDGTLIIAYFDDVAGRWMCATRSCCEAQGPLEGGGTFADLADATAREHGASSFADYMARAKADVGCTYMFELTAPDNRVVCAYERRDFTLLGVRRLADFQEFEPRGFPTAMRYSFARVDDLVAAMAAWPAFEREGVVVRDAQFRRIKVKSPAYLAAAHAAESIGSSWRACLEVVRAGHADDVAAVAPPSIVARIEAMRRALASVVARTEADLRALANVTDVKSFALVAQKCAWSAPMFAVRRGKVADVSAFAATCTIDNLLAHCMREMGAS